MIIEKQATPTTNPERVVFLNSRETNTNSPVLQGGESE